MAKQLIVTTSIRFSILFFILFALNGCKVVKGIYAIKKEKITTKKATYGSQAFIFVPIQHFGQKIFYQSLADSIKQWKDNDFRIYYEEVRGGDADSTEIDIARRKWRHIRAGAGASRADYQVLQTVFKNGIAQPKWKDLGVTDSDLNADITMIDLIAEYEVLYGIVQLNDCDKTTPLKRGMEGLEYNCSKGLKNDLQPIIIDYRNKKVFDFIKKNNDKKIVIIYGRRHIKGIRKLLENQIND